MGSRETVQLARPSRGHFDLGTGYHGDMWLDLDALLLRPARLREPVRWMAGRLRQHAVDAVCGPMEGGAFLAYAVSDLLATAALLALGDASTMIPEQLGVPFYPAATLPSQTWPAARCRLCAEGIPLTAPGTFLLLVLPGRRYRSRPVQPATRRKHYYQALCPGRTPPGVTGVPRVRYPGLHRRADDIRCHPAYVC